MAVEIPSQHAWEPCHHHSRFDGISNTITCGEASGHLAIGESFRVIQRGDADRAICGGSETKVNPLGLVRQVLLKRLAIDNNSNPAAALHPSMRTPAARFLAKEAAC